MATNAAFICVGAATVSIGDYVAAGGAGSLTDVGHTKGPVTLAPTFEDYEVKSERAYATLARIPQSNSLKLKVPMSEATAENLRIALRQPAANKSGTGNNLTLRVGDAKEQYHQVSVVTKGVGSTGVRTITLWKCFCEGLAEIPFAKGAEQVYEATFDCLYDDSVGTADKIGKWVDA